MIDFDPIYPQVQMINVYLVYNLVQMLDIGLVHTLLYFEKLDWYPDNP